MDWIPELGNFLRSLILSHWLPIVTTGAFSGIFEWYERHYRTKIPYAKYVRWVLVGGLTVSIFLTWQDEYRARIKVENDIADKSGQIKILGQDKERLREDIKDLDERYKAELSDIKRENDRLSMRNETLTKDLELKSLRIGQLEGYQKEKARRQSIRKDLARFLAQAEVIWSHCAEVDRGECQSVQWVNEVKMFLADKFDSSYVERFEHPGKITSLGHYPGSPIRSFSLKKLDGQKDFLREVIKEQS